MSEPGMVLILAFAGLGWLAFVKLRLLVERGDAVRATASAEE